MAKKVTMNNRSSKVRELFRCEECGATAARSGNPFTKFSLKVHQGLVHRTKKVAGKRLLHDLTRRQYEVMERIVTGWSERAVAKQLGLSIHTIGTHVKMSYRKLGVNNRTELVRKWLKQENRPTRSVEPLSPPLAVSSLRYCPGCGCHLAPMSRIIQPG
jgi:DNA-binding CsgD family transcriptional regulator